MNDLIRQIQAAQILAGEAAVIASLEGTGISTHNREMHDGKWYWVRYEGIGKTYEAPAIYRAGAKAFYSVEFSGIPTHQVLVLKEA